MNKSLKTVGLASILVISMIATLGSFAEATSEKHEESKDTRTCHHAHATTGFKCRPTQTSHSIDISELEHKIHDLEKRVALLEK